MYLFFVKNFIIFINLIYIILIVIIGIIPVIVSILSLSNHCYGIFSYNVIIQITNLIYLFFAWSIN